MDHMVERGRCSDGRLGYRCARCQQTWRRTPRSACPGVLVYFSWDHAQVAGLRTQTQWHAQRRRVLADAKPEGMVPTQKDWYWLYSEAQTTPMRTASRAQRAVLERGRRTQRTCQRCGREQKSITALEGRICDACYWAEEAEWEARCDAAARTQVATWARTLLSTRGQDIISGKVYATRHTRQQ